MRLVLAFALIAVAAAPAFAQNSSEQAKELLRQRLELQRINKGWEMQKQDSRERIEARCKAEARKHYSALRSIKRRQYARACIRRLGG